MIELAEQFGSGLETIDFAENRENDKMKLVGVYAPNSLEYLIQDISCIIYGFVTVPIYNTLGVEAIKFSLNQTKISTCIISSKHAAGIIEQREDFPHLKNLIIVDFANWQESPEMGKFQIYDFYEICKKGEQKMKEWADLEKDQLYCISYTSGTTGIPKGAMSSQQNIAVVLEDLAEKTLMKESDVHISYLPMAHIFERILYLLVCYSKSKLVFISGSVKNIKEDL